MTSADEVVDQAAGRAKLARLEQIEKNRISREKTRPPLQRGDRVVVHWTGISDKAGTVQTVKHSGPTKTWYCDVRMDDGLEWVVPASHIVKEA